MSNLISGKKGMGIGQVFVFIVMAISFALIMIFGYQAIAGFILSGEEVAFVGFKNDLEISVKKIYTEFDSLRIEEFYPPGKYSEICFVNMDYKIPGDDLSVAQREAFFEETIINLRGKNALAANVFSDAWELSYDGNPKTTGYKGVSSNTFLDPTSPVPIKVHDISLLEGIDNNNLKEVPFLCIEITGGRFTLGLKGAGDHTILFIPQRSQ